MTNLENTTDDEMDAMADIAAVLHEALTYEDQQAAKFVEEGVSLCKKLNGGGRVFDAIPVARACTILAERQKEDKRLPWVAANGAGIVMGCAGDYAGAIAEHARALRLAEEAKIPADQASSWNNLGGVFLGACSYELAIDAYSRGVELGLNAFSAYGSYINLAQAHLHLLDIPAGVASAKRALKLETEEIKRRDPYVGVILRNNLVRLLLLGAREKQARAYADEATHIAQTCQYPRALILAALSHAMIDVASGRYEEGIALMRRELVKARSNPKSLADTLWSISLAEKTAGRSGRARIYLEELSDYVHQSTVKVARRHLKISEFFSDTFSMAHDVIDEQRKELVAPWGRMSEWDTLERFAQSASLLCYGDAWHTQRTGDLMRLFAIDCGFDEPFAQELGMAAKLHNIGMSAVLPLLARKRETLSEDEARVVNRHTSYAVDILESSSHPRALLASEIARFQNEYWDGTGETPGLRGEAIPRTARMIAIVTRFNAALRTAARADRGVACAEIERLAGSQLDPQLVQRFTRSTQAGAIGRFLDLCQFDKTSSIESTLNGMLSHG